MKVNAKALAPVALVAAFGLGSLAPHAQTPAQKIGFVDVDALLQTQAGPKEARAIDTKLKTETADLQKQANAIIAKGNAATAAEKEKLNQLNATYQAKAQAAAKQVQALSAKMEAATKVVDTAISAAAKANGYSVVMDRAVAASSGLVVYADDGTDLTAAAQKNIK